MKDPKIFFIGTATSGLWKTVNCGTSFKPVFDHEDICSIGDVAVAPFDGNIVWVGSGEANLRNSTYYGNGVYKSTDGGRSWKNMGLKESHHIGRIVIHPQNPDIVYVAAQGHLYTPNPERGLYKTTDGGRNWKKVLEARLEDRYKELFSGKPPSHPTIGHQIFRTDDGGLTWRQVSPQGKSIGDRSNYYGQIRVDPNNANHVYVLGEMMYESSDGGTTWKQAFQFSDDHHELWIDPKDSKHMILGNDHGVVITYDQGQTWNYINYLPFAQLYAIGVDMDYPYNVYGGTQDNGSWKGPSTKKGRFPIRFEDWEHIGGGDGFYSQVDPTNNRWLYNESQFGEIRRVDLKTGQRKSIKYRGKEKLRFNWNAPFLLSPHNGNIIYHGANKLPPLLLQRRKLGDYNP